MAYSKAFLLLGLAFALLLFTSSEASARELGEDQASQSQENVQVNGAGEDFFHGLHGHHHHHHHGHHHHHHHHGHHGHGADGETMEVETEDGNN